MDEAKRLVKTLFSFKVDNGKIAAGYTLPTTGIPFVIVNGVIVVKNSEVLKDVFPGQAIRFLKTAPKFELLHVNSLNKLPD